MSAPVRKKTEWVEPRTDTEVTPLGRFLNALVERGVAGVADHDFAPPNPSGHVIDGGEPITDLFALAKELRSFGFGLVHHAGRHRLVERPARKRRRDQGWRCQDERCPSNFAPEWEGPLCPFGHVAKTVTVIDLRPERTA